MLRPDRCPRCNARLAITDTKCLDCGEDIAAHLEELRKAATAKRQLTPEEIRERAQKAAAAASRGRAFGVERSDETRLRTFDKQEAQVIQSDIVTSWVTAAIALAIGLAAIFVGAGQFRAAGAEGLKVLSMAQLREWGFGMVVQPPIMALVASGLAIGGLLCAVGQAWRAMTGQRSVAAVAKGEKPLFVTMHPTVRAGLIIVAAVCPPIGIVLGLIMKLAGRDEEIKSAGSLMFIVGLVVLGILVLNALWGLAAGLKPPAEPPGAKQVEETSLLPDAARWLRAVG